VTGPRTPDGPPKGWKVLLSSAFVLAVALGAWWQIVTDRGTRTLRLSLWVIAVSASIMLLMVAAGAVVALWDSRRRVGDT